MYFVKRVLLIICLCGFSFVALANKLNLGDDAKLQAQMDELIDNTPDPTEKTLKAADKLLEKGIKTHERGKYKKAIGYYQKVLNKVPTYGLAYYELALSQYTLGQIENAYANIVRTLVFNPGMEMAHILKASILDDAGYPEKATASLQALLEVHPGSAMGWLNLGITQFRQKLYGESEKSLKKSIDIDQTNASSFYFLFACAAMQGHNYEEEGWIEKYLAISDPRDSRREIAEKRKAELTNLQIYLDPKSETPELDLLEGMVRRQWQIKKHKEKYPTERGYKPSLAEEVEVAETLLALAAKKSDEASKYSSSRRLQKLALLKKEGLLEAYFYVELKDYLGEDDLQWGKVNESSIVAYKKWKGGES